MSNIINPDKKSFEKREVIKLLPSINQTDTLVKFFDSSVEHLFQPGKSKSVNGFIGQKPWYYNSKEDFYLQENNNEREFYQLEPASISKDGVTEDYTNLITYYDYINYLRFNGANIENHDRLFRQEYYSWCPPINLDMLLNYRQYYWIKEGPDIKNIIPSNTYIASGNKKKFKLPKERNIDDDPHDVFVSVNGITCEYLVDYSLTATEINFKRIPKKNSVISLSVFEKISRSDIEGKKHWTSSDIIVDNTIISGISLSTGMKIRLYEKNPGNPPTFVYNDYIVEGVGRNIKLVSDNTSSAIDIIPYYSYICDGLTDTYSLPNADVITEFVNSDGEEITNSGMLVKVDDEVYIEDLHFTIDYKKAKITFFNIYIPKDKSKLEIWLYRSINLDDILEQKEYTSPDFIKDEVKGVKFQNNLKIRFVGTIDTIISSKYSKDYIEEHFINQQFIITGVGDYIELDQDKSFQNSLDFKDYLVMERGDITGNPWSMGNRWFHRDVIDFSKLNKSVKYFQAKRPIIEFEKNIELYNYGRYRRKSVATIAKKTDVTGINFVIDGTTKIDYPDGIFNNIFQQIHNKNEATINGCELKSGMRLLVTTDDDPLINNRVYLVSRSSTGKIRLTMEVDGIVENGSPFYGEIISITSGYFGKNEFFWNDEIWKQAQKKIQTNQAPLFNLYDIDLNKLDDVGVYPNSDFNGNPLFGYQVNNNQKQRRDKELNKRLNFKTNNNVSEIMFENYLYTLDINGSLSEISHNKPHPLLGDESRRYTYLDFNTNERIDIDGFYFHRTFGETENEDTFSNDWYKADTLSKQYIINTFVSTGNESIFNLSIEPASSDDLIIIKNGIVLNKGEYRLVGKELHIAVSKENDFFEVKIWNQTFKDNDGFFMIPVNLQANPNNNEITTITRGGYYPQFSEIIQKQSDFSGEVYAINNYRDTERKKNLGMQILQNSAPLLKTMILASNKDNDYIYAARFVEREYIRFRNKVIQKAHEFDEKGIMDPKTNSPKQWLDEILKILNMAKNSDLPFSNNGVGMINETDESCYIPATPSYLGLYPCFEPTVYVDDTYEPAQTVLRCHDGSILMAYGDIRDYIILEFENRIYNSIDQKFKSDTSGLFNINNIVEGKYRKSKAKKWTKSQIYSALEYVYYNNSNYCCIKTITEDFKNKSFEEQFNNGFWTQTNVVDYGREEYIGVYKRIFERWCSNNSVDPRLNTQYDPQDPWTWNWSKASDIDGEKLPGHWRGIYYHYFDTDTPHITPWVMLGFTGKPEWWETIYGPAPYTKGNTLLWKHLEEGYIADGNRKGIDVAYKRTGLSRTIPVDDYGNLLNPIEAGIVLPNMIPSYQDARLSWEVGDYGPIENVWRRSESYPFAMSQVYYLLKPAQFIELCWEPTKITRLTFNDQIINLDTKNRPSNSKLMVHNEYDADNNRIRKFGIQQWISEWVTSQGQSVTTHFGNIIRGLTTNLVYKVGGYTNINNMTALADSYSVIPQEDMAIRLYNSPSIREEMYSGVIIQWTGSGWKVFGYDVLNPSFNIIPYDPTGKSVSFIIGGGGNDTIPDWKQNTSYSQGFKISYMGDVYTARKAHLSSKVFDYELWNLSSAAHTQPGVRIVEYTSYLDTIEHIPYGYEFLTQQDVYNFLLSYQRYLESRGWLFTEISSEGLPQDFRKYGKDFLYWTMLEVKPNDFIAISPISNNIKFKSEHGMVQNVEEIINGVYSILNKQGYPISSNNFVVSRFQDEISIKAISDTNTIYAARLYVTEMEHILIFNNKTIYNDIIYDPILNIRQARIRLQTYKTENWKGRLSAPGFIISGNMIVPNFEKSAENFRDMFELETFDEPVLQQYARHNFGFQNKTYMDKLLLSKVTHFDFYQGMIRQKGSLNSMKKILRSNHVSGGSDVKFLEEWAFRVGDFGAVDIRPSLEILLRQKQIKNNPQWIQFTDEPGSEENDDPNDDIITIYSNDERWMVKPKDLDLNTDNIQIFHNRSITQNYITDLKNAGPVKLNDVDYIYPDIYDFADSISNKENEYKEGDLTWVYSNSKGQFDVLKYVKGQISISEFFKTDDVIKIISDDMREKLIEISGDNTGFFEPGVYLMTESNKQNLVWKKDFGYDDTISTDSVTFTSTFDLIKDIRKNNTEATFETPTSGPDFVAPGIFKFVIIPKEKIETATLIKEIRLTTIENDGNNFRGLWEKSCKGNDSISNEKLIEEFGEEYSGGKAYEMPNFPTLTNGFVKAYINEIELPDNSFIISDSKNYILLSSVFFNNIAMDYRNILDTDTIRLEVISNPRIAIGTVSNLQRFIKFENTPDISNPMGTEKRIELPFYLSINDDNETNFNEDICLFVDHDGSTQGKIKFEIDVVYILGQDQQKIITFPKGSNANITGIEIGVNEPFDAQNIFGNNQLYIGDNDNINRYVGKNNFNPDMLKETGILPIESNTKLPYVYDQEQSLYIKFSQAWNEVLMKSLGFDPDNANIAKYDYLTTPNEYFRKAPKTYHYDKNDLSVYINGIRVKKYDENDNTNDLSYNVIENKDYSSYVYFGRFYETSLYDVTNGTENVSKTYDLPGSPDVTFYSSGSIKNIPLPNLKAVANINGGTITKIILENGGSNYIDFYTEVVALGTGKDTKLKPIIVDGVIQSILIENAGTIYENPPAIQIIDISNRPEVEKGFGAKAFAVLSDDSISSYVLTQNSEVTSVPEISITGHGKNAKANAVIRTGIKTIAITNGGSGYSSAPRVNILPKNGKDAEAVCIIGNDSSIEKIIITNKGKGYLKAPKVIISNPDNGITATAQAIVNSYGQVISIKILNSGFGYTKAPIITFDNSNTGGDFITATASINDAGSIDSIIPNTPGEFLFELGNEDNNWIDGPDILIEGNAHAVIGTLVQEKITGIRVTDYGSGYSLYDTSKDISEKVQVRVAEFKDNIQVSDWQNLENTPSLNNGYSISNNIVNFLSVPSFVPSVDDRKVMMQIIRHHAINVPRSEDVMIVSDDTKIRPATKGKLNVTINYTLTTSQLKLISPLDGTKTKDWEDFISNLKLDYYVWESIVFNTLDELDTFTEDHNVLWKNGEKVWVLNYKDNNIWAILERKEDKWDIFRIKNHKVDPFQFHNAIIYDKRNNNVDARLQLYDPAKGIIPGIADQEIWYKLDYDPAYYTNSENDEAQVDNDQAWGKQQVGRVWWNTKKTFFLDYEIGNPNEDDYLSYRAKNWGQLAPKTELEIYEWVESPVSPEYWNNYVKDFDKTDHEYFPSGELVYDNKFSWVEEETINSSGTIEKRYYFWIKNSSSFPKKPFRSLSLNEIKNSILNPTSNDLTWFAPINQRTLIVGGIKSILDDENTILQVNWKIGNPDMNHHKQWKLLRENDVRSKIPYSLWNKMRDSLVGWDDGTKIEKSYDNEETALGEIYRNYVNETPVGTLDGPKMVPDQHLSEVEMYGIKYRPRQTMFKPLVEIRDNKKFYRSSMKARKHFINTLNNIFYTDEVSFDLESIGFHVSSPYPQGRVYEYFVEHSNESRFTLPRNFDMDNGSVFIKDSNGNITPRDLYPGHGDFISGVNYKIEKEIINGDLYTTLIFPVEKNKLKHDPARFTTLIAKSKDYYDFVVDTLSERNEILFSGKFVKGMNILVKENNETSGFWTLWKGNVDPATLDPNKDVPDDVWELIEVQTYNLRDFITETDWWAEGYSFKTVINAFYNTVAQRNSSLPIPPVGYITKVYDDGYGKWIVSLWDGKTWATIGKEKFIKRFSSKFYDENRKIFGGPDYIDPKYGETWDTKRKLVNIWDDILNRDGSWELKILIDNLNGKLLHASSEYILDYRQANNLFFSMVHFAFTEQVLLDWVFKTSFLYLGNYNEPLLQTPIQVIDLSESLLEYIDEVKPYHVKIRDFVRRLNPPIDVGSFYTTDFDKPVYYDKRIASSLPDTDKSNAFRPLIVTPNENGTYDIADDEFEILNTNYWPISAVEEDKGKQYWRDWLNNFGFNPKQPENIVPDPMLIRRIKTSIAFNRVDDYYDIYFKDGRTDGTSIGGIGTEISKPSDSGSRFSFSGWDNMGRYGWDTYNWDESMYNNNNDNNSGDQKEGLPRNDPATLIDGIDFRGVFIDGYTFEYGLKEKELKSMPYFVLNREDGDDEIKPIESLLSAKDFYLSDYGNSSPKFKEKNKIIVYLYKQLSVYNSNENLSLIIFCGDFTNDEENIDILISGLPEKYSIGYIDGNVTTTINDNNTLRVGFEIHKDKISGIIIDNITDVDTLKIISNIVGTYTDWKLVSNDSSIITLPLIKQINIKQKDTKVWYENTEDVYDTLIDGRQMDQLQYYNEHNIEETEPYDIDVDGYDFNNPLYDPGHPPELVKISTPDPFVMSVYQNYSPGSPIIYSEREFGGYNFIHHSIYGNVWGPYYFGNDAQNIESVMVHINGLYKRLYDDYMVDVANKCIWFKDKSPEGKSGTVNPASISDVIQITSFSVGGGTPFQVLEYEGDGKTTEYDAPDKGMNDNKRLYAYLEKTNDFMIGDAAGAPWIIRNSTFTENFYSVAYGLYENKGIYVSVGDIASNLRINTLTKPSFASSVATIVTTREHHLRPGMKIKIYGDKTITQKQYLGYFVVSSIVDEKTFIIDDPSFENVQSPARGILYIEAQARIITSDNLIHWNSEVASGATSKFNKVVWNGRTDEFYKKHFIAVGDNGIIFTSEDGKNWIKRTSNTTKNIYDLDYNYDKKIWAAIGDGIILKSYDNGITWENILDSAKFAVGINIPLEGDISAEKDIQNYVSKEFLVEIGADKNHKGLSMGAMDLTYRDANGDPSTPDAGSPFLWEIDKIYILTDGFNGSEGNYVYSLVGGKGEKAEFVLRIEQDGTIYGKETEIKDVNGNLICVKEIPDSDIRSHGSYSLKPVEMMFSISGNALDVLGIKKGKYVTVLGDILNPTLSSGKKLTINRTSIVFKNNSTLDDIVSAINKKSLTTNVVAYNDNNKLKLTIQPLNSIFELSGENINDLPFGSTFHVTFKPKGRNLVESLLQNMLVWNNGDKIILVSQDNYDEIGLYEFSRGDAGSKYKLTLLGTPKIVMDENTGVSYFYNEEDKTYKRQILNLNGLKYINDYFFMVGNNGLIVASSDLVDFIHIELPNKSKHDLYKIDATDESFMTIGSNGYIMQSEDGFTWHENTQLSNKKLNDLCIPEAGSWIIVGEKGSIFRSKDNGITWKQDKSDVNTNIFSTQFLNNNIINTIHGVKKYYKLNGPQDGIIPADYTIKNNKVVFDPEQAPLPQYEHKLRLVNMGTLIKGMGNFVTKAQTEGQDKKPVYVVKGSCGENSTKDHIFITLNGIIKDNSFFEYEIRQGKKNTIETHITLNGNISPDMFLTVTLFDGPDKCVVHTDNYDPIIMSGTSPNVTYFNSGKEWTSGWKIGTLSQVPNSTFPREGTVIVKKNGNELFPPEIAKYTGDGINVRFPLPMPVDRNTKFDVYVDGQLQSIGMGVNNSCFIVIDYDINKIVEIDFYKPPKDKAKIIFVLYYDHDYIINYDAEKEEASLLIVNKKELVSEYIMSKEENTNDRRKIETLNRFFFSLPILVDKNNYDINVMLNNEPLSGERYIYKYFNNMINGIEILRSQDGTNGFEVDDALRLFAIPKDKVTIKDGDKFSIMSFRENDSLDINTEIFNGDRNENYFIIKNKPYNSDSIMVTINGNMQTHMNDYRVSNISAKGWDRYFWGGKEQYGPYLTWRINPLYIEYLNNSGCPPITLSYYHKGEIISFSGMIFNGLPLTEKVDINSAPLVEPKPYTIWHKNTKYSVNDYIYDLNTDAYYICIEDHTSGNTFNDDMIFWDKMVIYSGPPVYANRSTKTLHGPETKIYSWDSEFEGSIVEFDRLFTESDKVKVTTFSGQPYRPPFAWRVFKNNYEQWETIRIADIHKTYLANDLRLTNYSVSYKDYLEDDSFASKTTPEKSYEDYEYQFGQVIRLKVNPTISKKDLPYTILPTPDKDKHIPGVVWIKGERIEYFSIKNTYTIWKVETLEKLEEIVAKENEMAKIGNVFYVYKNSEWSEISEHDAKHNYLTDDDGNRIIELRNLKRGSESSSYGVPYVVDFIQITPTIEEKINGIKTTTTPSTNDFNIETYNTMDVILNDVQIYDYSTWISKHNNGHLTEQTVFYEFDNNILTFKVCVIDEKGNRTKEKIVLTENDILIVKGSVSDFNSTKTTYIKDTVVIDGSYQQKVPTFNPNPKKGTLAHSKEEAIRFLLSKSGTYE